MAGLEPVIHATAHNILDQPEGSRANRLVLEVDVQVFGLHRPIRRYGEFDATPSGPAKWAYGRGQGGDQRGGCYGKFHILKSSADSAVKQKPVPCDAHAATRRSEPSA